MNVTGIIAEYNPFHLGHLHQITYVREKLNSDYIIVAMSGDFVQRGTPALLSKYTRAEAALLCGADLVLELPVQVSSASAEFSSGEAVSSSYRIRSRGSVMFRKRRGGLWRECSWPPVF